MLHSSLSSNKCSTCRDCPLVAFVCSKLQSHFFPAPMQFKQINKVILSASCWWISQGSRQRIFPQLENTYSSLAAHHLFSITCVLGVHAFHNTLCCLQYELEYFCLSCRKYVVDIRPSGYVGGKEQLAIG